MVFINDVQITDDVDGCLIVCCCFGRRPKQQRFLCHAMNATMRAREGALRAGMFLHTCASKEVKYQSKFTNL